MVRVVSRRWRTSAAAAFAALFIGCTPRPQGPVFVPPTEAGQACKKDCDQHNSGCMGVCGMEAGFAGDPNSVCKPKCESALRDCYIHCPGAHVATPGSND